MVENARSVSYPVVTELQFARLARLWPFLPPSSASSGISHFELMGFVGSEAAGEVYKPGLQRKDLIRSKETNMEHASRLYEFFRGNNVVQVRTRHGFEIRTLPESYEEPQGTDREQRFATVEVAAIDQIAVMLESARQLLMTATRELHRLRRISPKESA